MSEGKFEPKVLESQGKSIDEAIFKGIQEMGLSIDEVRIETIQEGSKGLLGLGSKPFVVRLTQRDPNEFDEPAAPQEAAPRESAAHSQAQQRPQSRERDGGYNRNSNYDRNDRNRGYAGRPSQPQRDRYPRNNQGGGRRNDYQRNNYQRNDYRERNRYEDNLPPLPSVSRVTQPVEYIAYVPGESQVLGAEFLLGVLERMGVRATLEYYQDDESIKFRIDSGNMGILIGHRGETLDALQYLTSLVINKELEGYIHVMLDTEGYRAKREESLIRLARKMASQVMATGRNAELEPMNPYERRVLHAALQDYPGVTTYSEGEEGDRHVIIAPDNSEAEA